MARISRTAAFSTGSASIKSFKSAALFAAFVVLAGLNAVRVFRHAMWRDELQAFMLAANSPTLVDLFQNLKYEGHPGLWHALLWVVTRFTAEPAAMQAVHLTIALGIWLLIFRASPFTTGEKFLLVLSYFMFWEYFVVSRSYALMVLLGFAFVALRASRPGQFFLPWLLLGLLANTIVFGTIWSMVLAVMFVWRAPWRTRSFLLGTTVYGVLLGFAVLTMMPAPDMAIFQPRPRLNWQGTGVLLGYPLDSLIPLFPLWISETMTWLGEPNPARGFDPRGAILGLLLIDVDHPLRVALLAVSPIALCWFVTRNAARTVEFSVAYLGVLLFAQLWHFAGSARHHGVVFVMLVGAVWATRAALPRTTNIAWRWFPILLVGAAGGMTTLSSELHPFSEGRNVATWLQRNRMAAAPIIGSRDSTISPISGYLGRPIYYLECECLGTFIVWNNKREQTLDIHEIARRTARALKASGWIDALLILNGDRTQQLEAVAPDFSFEILERFSGAVAVSDENYVVYRVRMR